MDFASAMVLLSAIYLAPHLDPQFARVLSAGCMLLAIASVIYKLF